jgi:hypothetical protein
MPALELGRLQQEAALLSQDFGDPAQYLRGLENLLNSYANQVHRQGRVRGPRPVLFTFEVPQPMLRQLQLEMAMQARQLPEQALAVADALWARRSIETRQLAARLLGVIPASDAGQVTNRLATWAQENREETIAPEIWGRGVLYLATHKPEALIAFIGEQLASTEPRQQIMALGALRTLLEENNYANLPALFNLVSTLSQDPPKRLRPPLAEVFIALAERSPKETEFFLQQHLESKPSEGAQWLARQTMKALPEESQQRLRQTMQPK